MDKVVVFDLDETIGYFFQLSLFMEVLEMYYNVVFDNKSFFKLLDIFPEVFRPFIFKIFKFLIKKVKTGECSKILIYTNNQGPVKWAKDIAKYIEYKLDSKIFEKIIPAYKVGGRIIAPCRTTNEKTKKDLIKCGDLKPKTNICFLDDVYHDKMHVNDVYYLNIKPYVYNFTSKEFAERYYSAFNLTIDKNIFINDIVNKMKNYRVSQIKNSKNIINIDKILSKQTYIFVKDFFKNSKKNRITKKNKDRIKKAKKLTKKI
tara:strand:- start:4212 stop:4991 length:780 start_codon:yes stop_codon:yes gene_type:complete